MSPADLAACDIIKEDCGKAPQREFSMNDIKFENLVQASKPDLGRYHLFKVRNGCKGSQIIEILKVFEEFGANVGYLVDANKSEGTSAMMFTAPRMALRFIPDAINPDIDNYGLRGRSYLCDKPEAIEAAMAAFPSDVTAEEDIYLPLSSISDLRPLKLSITALHQRFLDSDAEKKAPKP
jgi:hypothetical protein